ncbi:Cytoplasmic tRNA 2-thiolation protein 2 [Paramicrosporidium saccamoebae]|uniref:Cytoplasmic tRNA 2-thiolation protein 2 n=1 Tax=Paramicrosporidium saccamoebae TaxID=1246581 RepID=A0A2H9TFR4_9FUNG|nr:Cytoplasmic tRNA 2-thiolation protein 2 [Paramicrosporidium saccamoebae]
MDSAGNPIIAGQCIKCKSKPFTINVRYAVYCEYYCYPKLLNDRACFQDQVYHKYRNQTRNPSGPGSILVGYSGGLSSQYCQLCFTRRFSLLLHLTQQARIQDPNRKNLDTYYFVHITRGGDSAEKPEFVKNVFDSYGVAIESYTLADCLYNGEPERLQQLLDACESDTLRVDLVRILTRVALVRIAQQRGIGKVYVGENCSRLAVDIMADTCTGRGVSLPWKYSLAQAYSDVSVIRPLRDLVNLEVNFYLDSIKNQCPMPRQSTMTKADSIYGLTDNFITGLDLENSATVSTVVRTTAKIETCISRLEDLKPCALCMAPLPPNEGRPFCFGCHQIFEGMDVSHASILPSHTQAILTTYK